MAEWHGAFRPRPGGLKQLADFAFVRDRLGLSDSALSKQFGTLEEAGYMAIERPVSDRRRRVRVRLTDAGATAFEGHVVALRAVIASAEGATARR